MNNFSFLPTIAIFVFFYTLLLTLTEIKPPSTVFKKKARHQTLLPPANGRGISKSLARNISELGGYRLALFQDGWYVFSEPLNLLTFGYFHLVGITDAGVEVRTVCRQIGSLYDRKIHTRFADTVMTMIALDTDIS